MSKIAYVRVSTQEQNEARQREALAAHGIDKAKQSDYNVRFSR